MTIGLHLMVIKNPETGHVEVRGGGCNGDCDCEDEILSAFLQENRTHNRSVVREITYSFNGYDTKKNEFCD
jgi:hypothetical protein